MPLRLLRCDLVHWVCRRTRRAMVVLHTCEVEIKAHEGRKEGEDWVDGWSAFVHGGRRGGGREGGRQIERGMDSEREIDALSTMETTPRSGTYADATMWTIHHAYGCGDVLASSFWMVYESSEVDFSETSYTARGVSVTQEKRGISIGTVGETVWYLDERDEVVHPGEHHDLRGRTRKKSPIHESAPWHTGNSVKQERDGTRAVKKVGTMNT
ncbi:hypothetical protein B0H14DRAFT_2589836 [Mycena olivaceomarginata]|nr:hypothetical protein B0H14DRAFT_2589836 [Mycena olivaceomarginata]